jgi:hypothetical protein
VKNKDPRLIKIAKWHNDATENEYTWIMYILVWYDQNIYDQLRLLDFKEVNFLLDCQTDEVFTTVTPELEGLSEKEKREEYQRQSEEQLQRQEVIDYSTGKPYVEQPDPVGPFLDGAFRNGPPLNGRSRKRIIEILPTVFELRKEGLLHKWKIPDKWKKLSFDKRLELGLFVKPQEGLDVFLNHPRLKQCSNPECKKWFVVSKTDQKFCQTAASDRPINPRTGKPRPPCRIVAYQRTPEYRNKTAAKMANWRANKD